MPASDLMDALAVTPEAERLAAFDNGLRDLELAHDETMRIASTKYALLRRLEQRVLELEYRLRWYEANVPAIAQARQACDRHMRAQRKAWKHGVLAL